MKKKTALLLSFVLLFGLFGQSGCVPSSPAEVTADWTEFENEVLSNEVRVNVRNGRVFLRWADDKTQAERYVIYY
ncbi:MAG: hypothetical protein J6Z36_03795, partial [Clostridia bacterium]|nr:hypothetical protein [Clostridia bacterium]